MSRVLRALAREIWRTIRSPRRMARAFDRRARQWLRNRLVPTRAGGWGQRQAQGLRARQYDEYGDYVRHQASKVIELGDLTAYDARFREALTARLRALAYEWTGRRVLCLGARTGAELRAFQAVGAQAHGIDLAPADPTGQVQQGDFHDLRFAEASLDVVYTNSLDHALDLPKVVAEIRRVLASGGLAILEIQPGQSEGVTFDRWAATAWERAEDVITVFRLAGFEERGRQEFDVPWAGLQVVLDR